MNRDSLKELDKDSLLSWESSSEDSILKSESNRDCSLSWESNWGSNGLFFESGIEQGLSSEFGFEQ